MTTKAVEVFEKEFPALASQFSFKTFSRESNQSSYLERFNIGSYANRWWKIFDILGNS